jgi:hypothetical protein
MVECGHRCSVCGDPTALEKAHIIPWGKRKEHKFENLVVLCANCHTRSHSENWSTEVLREYKKKPWVARYRSVRDDAMAERAVVELRLDLRPENFDSIERERILNAIAAVLDICPKDVVTLQIRAGSIFVIYEIPQNKVERLMYHQDTAFLLFFLAQPTRIGQVADLTNVWPQMATERSPIGTIAMTGDPCPESGRWELIGTSKSKVISAGAKMPSYKHATVSWILVRYADRDHPGEGEGPRLGSSGPQNSAAF